MEVRHVTVDPAATRSGSGGQPWAEPVLDIDEDAIAERAEPIILDREIRVLARANRIALVREPAARHPGQLPGLDAIDFPLRCVAHAHPDCRFRWVRITLDLAGASGSSIRDLSPRDEITDHPVKITTSYHGGLSFAVAALPLHPDLAAERTTERDVYFPTITTSGIGLTHAIWDFTAVASNALHVDRSLRLLATIPASTPQVPVKITLRASVIARGVLGAIPLIGRQSATIPVDDHV
jgi:hypothetical protein